MQFALFAVEIYLSDPLPLNFFAFTRREARFDILYFGLAVLGMNNHNEVKLSYPLSNIFKLGLVYNTLVQTFNLTVQCAHH